MRFQLFPSVGVIIFALITSSVWAASSSSTNFKMQAQSLDASGGLSTSSNFSVSACVGATVVGSSSSSTFRLDAGCAVPLSAPIALSPASLTTGIFGTAYSAAVTASGGTLPYSYAITAGALPTGLSLSSNGAVSGTPNVSGTFAFTVTATDSSTGTGPHMGSRDYLLEITATVPDAPNISTATAGNAQASIAFTTPATNGGVAIIGYTVTSSPGGLTGIGTSSPITVTGLTNGMAYTFTVTATNSVGTGSASVASNIITPLSDTHMGTTAGGTVTAAIIGGSCVGFQNGSAQYNMPDTSPYGQRFPYGAFSFTAVNCGTGGSVTITQTYPNGIPLNAKYHKLINGHWVDWTPQASIMGNTVTLTLTDGQLGDTNPAPGAISDQGGITLPDESSFAPVPTLSEWVFLLLVSLMAFITFAKVRRCNRLS